jgi:hypothetical protein
MINFSLNEMKIMKLLLKGDDYEPTDKELEYIEKLGEKRALKLLTAVENKLDKILSIRQKYEQKK